MLESPLVGTSGTEDWAATLGSVASWLIGLWLSLAGDEISVGFRANTVIFKKDGCDRRHSCLADK